MRGALLSVLFSLYQVHVECFLFSATVNRARHTLHASTEIPSNAAGSYADLFGVDSTKQLIKFLNDTEGLANNKEDKKVAAVATPTAVKDPPTNENAAIFAAVETVTINPTESTKKAKNVLENQEDLLISEAAKLRKEAQDLETNLRAEALSKGLTEEMVNKLIPISRNTAWQKPTPSVPVPAPVSAPVALISEESSSFVDYSTSPSSSRDSNEIRGKLGYLPVGDALKFSADMERVKARGFARKWNVKEFSKTNFQASAGQLKSKTGVDPINLKLDDVGFNYQNVFIAALVAGTVLGLASSTVGGQLGFILGYSSALIPVTLVGIGSVAPILLGEIINKVKMQLDEEAKKRYVRLNAGKFVVGYVLGLPVEKFSKGGDSNTVDFYQLKPSSRKPVTREQQQMFAKKQFKQADIASSSIVCLAGNMAECIDFGSASGTNAVDVNILYELINSVEPPLAPGKVQDHIRWAAVTAFEILTTYKEEYKAVVSAFEQGLSLEECIAELEAVQSSSASASTKVEQDVLANQ